ncbi:hypothetical protein NLJ89_g9449 [Agrocybe chaxingu]|uniref:Uncharacterized protein n=1 Tax=Agrocybe chaxingu TaxID=84603 RepID=A0A9W8JT12_9AGAR|nr:hypothetical protein NLJ89_g9449 [Agrocybe chaxingu]
MQAIDELQDNLKKTAKSLSGLSSLSDQIPDQNRAAYDDPSLGLVELGLMRPPHSPDRIQLPTDYVFNKFQKYKHPRVIITRTPPTPTALIFILPKRPSTTDSTPDVAPKAVTCPAPSPKLPAVAVPVVDTVEIIVVMSGPPTCVCSAVLEIEASDVVSDTVLLVDELLEVVSEGNVRTLSVDDDDAGGGANVVELHAGKPGTVTVAILANEHWELYPGWRHHEESSGRPLKLELGWRVQHSPSATFARSNAVLGDAVTKQLIQAWSGSSIFFVHRQVRVSHVFQSMGSADWSEADSRRSAHLGSL